MKIKISLPTEAERAKVLETCFNSQKNFWDSILPQTRFLKDKKWKFYLKFRLNCLFESRLTI